MSDYTGYARLEPVNKENSVEKGIQACVMDPLWMIGRQWQMGEFQAVNGGSAVRAACKIRGSFPDKIGILKNTATGITEIEKPYNLYAPLESTVQAENPDNQSDAWDSSRFEYNFKIRNSSTELSAKQYDGNHLDWYHFNINSAADSPSDSIEEIVAKPLLISYKGMPASRWWEFEDKRIDIGKMQRPYLNFLSMLLMEFALTDSNDWYIIPIRHPVGSIRKIETLHMIDSFGVVTTLNPVMDNTPGKKGWEVFTITENNTPQNTNDGRLFYLPNSIHFSLESKPYEKINLLLDEMANLVWAVEQGFLDGNGNTINRNDELKPNCSVCGYKSISDEDLEIHVEKAHGADSRRYWNPLTNTAITREEYLNLSDSEREKCTGPLSIYRQKTYVPENWIPYFANQINADGQIQLRRGRTKQDISDGLQYKGVILKESKFIQEEAVQRTGLMVNRFAQLARGTDGKLYFWKSRRRNIDERKDPSGLEFDHLGDK